MMQSRLLRPGAAFAVLALAFAFIGNCVAGDEAFGTIKGQVVFAGQVVPPNNPANIDKDKDHCLKDGQILGRGTYEVSGDGKTLTVSTDEQRIVLDRG